MDLFAGMPQGTLGAFFASTNGAAIQRNFSVQAGQTITFDWNYRSGDWAGYDDASWVSVNGAAPVVLARTSFTAGPISGGTITPDGLWTGWQSFSWTVTEAEATLGSMTMTMGVNNSYDTAYPSWLAIDNFRINGSLIENSGFDDGNLTEWLAIGDVSAQMSANTFPNFTVDGDQDGVTYGQTAYEFVPSQGDWFALIFGVGADATGSAAPGSLPQIPILPPPPSADDPFTWIFEDVPSGVWTDPPFADGFLYQGLNGTLFDSIEFPIGNSFLNFSNLTLSSPGCTINDLFGNGAGNASTFSFTNNCGGPVSQFSITGTPGLFDAGNNAAFPLNITFNAPVGSFSQTAINPQVDVVVPEPSTVALCAAGLGLVLWRRRRIS